MATRSSTRLLTAPLGWRRWLLLPLAVCLHFNVGCGPRVREVLVARRIEPRVREVFEAQEGRARLAVPREGIVPILLVADGMSLPAPLKQPLSARPGGGTPDVVVSLGVPFPPGVLRDATRLWLRDARATQVPLRSEALAIWPLDGSLRSALVVFRAALVPGERAIYTLIYGDSVAPPGIGAAPPTKSAPSQRAGAPGAGGKRAEPVRRLSPRLDGPITATLPASWYAASQVSGPQLPALEDSRFPDFESGIERGLAMMSPAFDSYGVSCFGQHRTYYDSPHALYQRFLRNGDAARFRRARKEAVWYREHELKFSPDRSLALHVCQKEGWSPREPLSWEVLRRLLGQGMLDDYLLTGDPAAREAVVGMGEVLRLDLAALTEGKEDILLATERNMAWTLMAMSSYYAVDPRPELLSTLRKLMDRTIAWQNRGRSGAFEHDLHRADPLECERGPRGGSPFMTALLVDALMGYGELTGDSRVRDVVVRVAAWLSERTMTSDRRAFRYLWGCETDLYDDSGTADLNLLIVPVFGAAYALTHERRWLALGDELADIGVREMNLNQPKHWNQAMRGFGRYLGYRSEPMFSARATVSR